MVGGFNVRKAVSDLLKRKQTTPQPIKGQKQLMASTTTTPAATSAPNSAKPNNFSHVLSSIFSYFPFVLQAVVGVEQQISAPGATKKQIVMNAIQAAATVGEEIPIPVVQGISTLVDNTVATLKSSGVFGTSPTTATMITPPTTTTS